MYNHLTHQESVPRHGANCRCGGADRATMADVPVAVRYLARWPVGSRGSGSPWGMANPRSMMGWLVMVALALPMALLWCLPAGAQVQVPPAQVGIAQQSAHHLLAMGNPITGIKVATTKTVAKKPSQPSARRSPDVASSGSPTALASVVAEPPVAPVGGGMGLLLKPDPKPTATKVSDLKPEPRPSSLATAFLGADDWSQYTLSGPRPAFIDGEQRLSLPMAEPTIELARFFNGTARTLVAFTVWLTDNVVNFGIGQVLVPVATAVGKALHVGVIGKVRLGDVALLIAIVVIAWRAITGNRVHAIRDTLMGIAIVGLGAIGMATPQGPVCASLSVVAGLSRFFITLTSGGGDLGLVDICVVEAGSSATSTVVAGVTSVFAPIKSNLFATFVQEPFLALQWGQLSDQCKQLALDIANAGYFGDSAEPRHVMSANGCAAAANFNGSAGVDRAVFAGLHLLMVGGWSLGMMVLLGPFVAAQGVGAVLIMSAPLVWAVGAIPGLGHQALGTWIYTGFRAAIALVMSGAVIAVVLRASTVIAPANQHLLAIFVPTMMVMGLALMKWRQRPGVAR